MKKSPFEKWFVAQHGKRSAVSASDEHLREIVFKGETAKIELTNRRIYDARKQSALYAWTAKDKSEREILKQIKKKP